MSDETNNPNPDINIDVGGNTEKSAILAGTGNTLAQSQTVNQSGKFGLQGDHSQGIIQVENVEQLIQNLGVSPDRFESLVEEHGVTNNPINQVFTTT